MRTLILTVCLISCLLLPGCKKSSDATGKWTGAIDAGANANDPGAQMAAKMLGNITMELKPDHTFAMTMMLPFEGTWTQSGPTVTLTVTKAMGMDMASMKQAAAAKGQDTSKSDKPMVFTVSSDGNSMTGQDQSGKGSITFKRDAAK